MGLVYLARRDDSPDSLVAVKMIKPELAEHEELRDLFAQEIASAQRLSSMASRDSHVARTVDADATASRPWLATEFVPGPSLADEVAARPQPTARVLEVARALAAAVVAMHAEGLIHGDLKPSNVVLGPDGLRLVDLGLAREHAQDDDDSAARFGSPGWSAPEMRGGAAGPAVDVYGWGMTVAFAATGRPAFGRGPLDLVHHRMLTSTPDLQGVPGPLLPLVAAALNPDPDLRPSADDVLARVDAVRGTAAQGARPQDESSDVTGAWVAPTLREEMSDETDRRRSSLLAAGTVAAVTVAVVLLCLLVVTAIGPGTPSDPSATPPPTASETITAGSGPSSATTPADTRPAARAVAPSPAAAGPAKASGDGPGKANGNANGKAKDGGGPRGPDKPKKP